MVFLEFVQVFYKHGALSFFWIVCFLINMIMTALILTIVIIVICIFCYFSNIFNRVETVRYAKANCLDPDLWNRDRCKLFHALLSYTLVHQITSNDPGIEGWSGKEKRGGVGAGEGEQKGWTSSPNVINSVTYIRTSTTQLCTLGLLYFTINHLLIWSTTSNMTS